MSSPNASATLDPAPRRRGAAGSAAPMPRRASAAAAAAADQVDPFPPRFSVLDFEDDVLPDSDWGDDDVFRGTEMVYLSEPPAADVDFNFDTDTEDQIVAIGNEIDRALDEAALCWDCLRIEDETREEFEWEEVGEIEEPLDEREVLSMMLGSEEEAAGVLRGFEEINARNVDWEFLGANFADDQEGFVYTSEYDVLVGQFAEHDSGKGAPPAAKSVVESLPSVVLTEEDVCNKNTMCAVCKDEIAVEERAKKLPCSHHYHEECILQWLGIRNTCPLCRFELLTDDVEYENWKAQRGGSETSVEEGRLRFGFEMLPEMHEM